MSVSPPQAPEIFNEAARRRKRARALRMGGEADFLLERIAEDVVDRLESVLKRFEPALFYGPGAMALKAALTETCDVGDVVTAEEAPGRTDLACPAAALPFADGHFGLVVSVMALHAVNDLPRALLEARRVLAPDGLFIAVLPGERTLFELREVLQSAEAAVTGRVAPRVAPLLAVKDGGALLQRAGFALPVADLWRVPLEYQEPMRLFRDLRAMGETSTLAQGPKGALRRDVLGAALSIYRDRYVAEEGGIRATVELVALTGWAPHQSQPKPLKPGSATHSLADAVRDQGKDEEA